ncbi:MAG: hypothetical protein WC877_06775 [Dehalococcoidales bacterium]
MLKGDDGKPGPQGEPGDLSGAVEVFYHTVLASESTRSSSGYYTIFIEDGFFEAGCGYSVWLKAESAIVAMDWSQYFCSVADSSIYFTSLLNLVDSEIMVIKTKPAGS